MLLQNWGEVGQLLNQRIQLVAVLLLFSLQGLSLRLVGLIEAIAAGLQGLLLLKLRLQGLVLNF